MHLFAPGPAQDRHYGNEDVGPVEQAAAETLSDVRERIAAVKQVRPLSSTVLQ
jgi:hypothetical protein